MESIEGFSITDEQTARIKIIRGHHDFIGDLIAKVDACVDEKYEGEINLLRAIPGIDRRSVITAISEIGANMDQFGSSKRLCSWAGLTPGNNESAGKKKSVRIASGHKTTSTADTKKAAIRAEYIAKGVFVPVRGLPQLEPMKAVI